VTENADQKQAPGRFQPGQSGNPAGKPRGTRNAALAALDAIGQEGAEGVLRGVVAKAKGGDLKAAEIVLRRVWPEQKGRTLAIDLPPLECAADLAKALGAIVQAVAAGEVTPEEAGALAGVLELHRRAIDTADLDARLAAIEQRIEADNARHR